MLAEQRTEVILSELAERRAVSVTDLCQATGASEATIRRDLNALARQRRLNKVHGGAVLIEEEYHVMEPDMEIKRQLYTEEKDRIARYAVGLIEDDDVVYMDAGTSVLQMVQHLQAGLAQLDSDSDNLDMHNLLECALQDSRERVRLHANFNILYVLVQVAAVFSLIAMIIVKWR